MKLATYCILIFLLISSCSKPSYNKYEIIGEIIGKPDIEYIYMDRFDDNDMSIDSSKIVDGKFSFEGNIDFPEPYGITFWYKSKIQGVALLYLEPSVINVLVYTDSMSKPKVSGSETQQFYEDYTQKRIDLFVSEIWQLDDKIELLKNSNDTTSIKILQERIDELWQLNRDYAIEYVETNPESPLNPFILLSHKSFIEFEKFQRLLNELDPILDSTVIMMDIKAWEKAEITRNQFTEFREIKSDTYQGNNIVLSELLAENEYILVEFWASWCSPCIQEIPNLVDCFEKYNNSGFDILGVSIDKDETAWRNALKEHKLTWTNILDSNGNIKKEYAISSIPHNYLINKQGEVVARNLRGENLRNQLEELLNN